MNKLWNFLTFELLEEKLMRKVISVLICIAVLLFVSVSIAEANRSITIKSETNVVFLCHRMSH